MRGGNRQVALIALEALSLWFLLSVWTRSILRIGAPPAHRRETWARRLVLTFLMLSPIWLAIVYLVPFASGFVSGLAGRSVYGPLMNAAAIPIAAALPVSLAPDATKASLLAGLPLLAGFIAGYASRLSQLRRLFGLVAGMAFLQVLLGLLQAAGGQQSSLYFSVEFGGGALGTFANTNHFANYLGMALAGYIWLGWEKMVLPSFGGTASSGAHFAERHVKALWIAGGVVLVLGILMARSRGAAIAGLPAAALAVGVASANGGRSQRVTMLLVAGTLVTALALVGIGALVSRFDLNRLAAAASFRGLLASSTLTGAWEFWPWGAGWGTYASVYPRFQPIGIDGYADYAHQDYAQMLFEGGVFAVLLAAAVLWLAIGRFRRLVRAASKKGVLAADEVTAAICGLGLLGFLVHSLVDFNMHIPANAILGALLAGAYLRPLPSSPTPDDRLA